MSSIHDSLSKQTPLVGSEAQDSITGLAFDGDFIWASTGTHVLKYIRGKEVCVVLAYTTPHTHLSSQVWPLDQSFGDADNCASRVWLSLTDFDGRWT